MNDERRSGCAVEVAVPSATLKGTVHIDELMIERVCAAVEAVVSKQIAALKKTVDEISTSPGEQKTRPATPLGVDLSDEELGRVVGLRTSLLNGKLPKDAGLLIDTKTTAKLLNVSARSLYRLHELKAVPEPVRLGGNIIRWRLAEILQWIERGCPSHQSWSSPKRRKQAFGQTNRKAHDGEDQRP